MCGRAIVGSLATLVIVAQAAPAWACQPGPWTQAPAYAAPNALVPKNIPAVYVFPGWFGGDGCKASQVTLSKSPSLPTALTVSPGEPHTHLLAGELEEGATYLLDYSGNCLPKGPGQVVFEAGPSRPLPLETGTLELIASGTGSVSWWDGACHWGVGAAWAKLRLRPSCDLVPFLPVTRFTAEVNGQVWWSSPVGSTTGNEVADNRTVDLVWLACSAASSWLTPSGKVVLTMRAHLAGAATDPAPAELTIPMSCDAADATLAPAPSKEGLVDLTGPCVSSPDAASPDAASPDAASSDAASSDAGASDGMPTLDAEAGTAGPAARGRSAELQPSGGCACSTQPSRGMLDPLGAVATAVLGARLARRRRR